MPPTLAKLFELMDRIEDARIERELPQVGQGHEPHGSVSDWPACSGVLRLYPSGARACDCGDVVVPEPFSGCVGD